MKTIFSTLIFAVLPVLVWVNSAAKAGEEKDTFLINQNGEYGYINRIGKIVIEPKFRMAYDFAGGLARVRVGERCGFIDKRGRIVIPPDFGCGDYDLGDFSEGLARFKRQDRYGFIDTSGKVVIDPQFDSASWFYEGLASVKIGDHYGFIDGTGKVVIEPKFENAWRFSEGLAAVAFDCSKGYGFIDETGKVVIEPKFNDTRWFSEGLAAVEVRSKVPARYGFREELKWGFIDKTGKMVIEPQFDDVWRFSEGLAKVRLGGKYGFIDTTGKIVIQLKFDLDYRAVEFRDGLLNVTLEENGKYGYIDKSGRTVIKPQFIRADLFAGGLAYVQVSAGEYGYIDKKNKRVFWISDTALPKIEGYRVKKINFINKEVEVEISFRNIKGGIQNAGFSFGYNYSYGGGAGPGRFKSFKSSQRTGDDTEQGKGILVIKCEWLASTSFQSGDEAELSLSITDSQGRRDGKTVRQVVVGVP